MNQLVAVRMLQTTLKCAALLFKSAVARRALKRESFTVAPQSQRSPLQNFNILYFSVVFTIPQWIWCKLAEQGRCKQESGNSNFFSSPSLPPDFGTVGVGFSLNWQRSQLSSLIHRLVLSCSPTDAHSIPIMLLILMLLLLRSTNSWCGF